jgi:hypothetical protein
MTDQRREVSYISPSPPYADPLTILAPTDTYYTIDRISLPVPSTSQTGLEKYVSSFLFFVFFFYMIYHIVLACFNCSLEDTNLGWIRASFFLNIPFVLAVCIYIIHYIKTKKIPSLTHFRTTIIIYISVFLFYFFEGGIYAEIDELKMIRKTLENATVISSLPCSTNYYENVYGLKISQYSFIILCLFLLCCLCCFHVPSKNIKDAIKERCNQFISFIINQWRYFTGIIFKRHQGETIIQRY